MKQGISLWVIVFFALLFNACQPLPEELWGKWRSAPPTSMLFEYRRDKTVYLIDGTRAYLVYRYKVKGNVLQLFDGMGRLREYEFEIKDGKMTLKELGNDRFLYFVRE